MDATLLRSHSVDAATARRIAQAAAAAASAAGVNVCVAVMDSAGALITFDRMDRAPLLCVQLAQDKAYTVASFGMATHEWWEFVKDEPALVHGVVKTERLVVYGGGLPVYLDGDLVAAVGVAGGTPAQDRLFAEAGVRSVS